MKSKFLAIFAAVFLIACATIGLVGCGDGEDEEEKSVSMLTVAQMPNKTTYEEGEIFDSTGLIINAVYSDNSIEENVEYNVKNKNELTTNDKSVAVTYGGKSINVSIKVTYKGNNAIYSVENTPAIESSKLEGKTYLFLGSSVTYGYGSDGESMADFIAKRNSCTVIKEAVSGTTLADIDDDKKGKSYVKRLEEYIASSDKAEHLDAFVCQLSTNDMYDTASFGTVTDESVTNKDEFVKETTYGAIEYIIALVKETWNCPIVFYTNNNIPNENYETMISALHQIETKWSISVIDLYNDTDFNNITDEQRALYMTDNVHPTKAGYRDWWTPKFEECLSGLID